METLSIFPPQFLHPNFHNIQASTTCSYSTDTTPKLTHVDLHGKASMVDVTAKKTTVRTATAKAIIKVGSTITNLIKVNNLKKGDVLSMAQIAGIVGAKRTSEIIPLCHNIPLTGIKVTAQLDEKRESVIIHATIQCEGKTGVEMEALTAASIAALTVYDMCKAVSHNITITNISLVSKRGGSKGDYDGEVYVRDYETAPIAKESVFLGGV